MNRLFCMLVLSLGVAFSAMGQTATVFTMDLDDNPAPFLTADDKVTYDADGGIQVISGTTEPTIKVFLPTEYRNTGAAVIILSGGALMFHSWGNDVEKMASWLNDRGIAVIGLKYRLRQMPQRPAEGAAEGGARPAKGARPANGAARQAPAGGNPLAMRLQIPDITGFDQLKKANASPDQSGRPDPSLDAAVEDALRTIRLVRAHADAWGIDPQRVGFLGYSAGGGVAIDATLKADAASMPSFLASCYGPSLVDVTVPENAPKLFIAVRAKHNNVAAGMLALFMEWRKAGVGAEMYIYDDGEGPFGPGDATTTSGAWREHFHRWLLSNGWLGQ